MPINSTRGAGSAKGFGFTGKTGLSGDIALFGGQFASPVAIEFVQITTAGNSTDFGDLSTNDMSIGASNGVRGLFCGTNSPTGIQYNNTIDFVNIRSKGNSTDFGDATVGHNQGSGGNNSTRGIFCAGVNGTDPSAAITNTIDFVTMASQGNGTDFGDTSQTLWRSPATACSGTRMCIAGGSFSGSGNPETSVIEFITTATAGNATDFGDLTVTRRGAGGNNASSGTRGVFGGGFPTTNVIDYITIASAGNALDFGDLTVARNGASATSNVTRALWAGGNGNNVIDFITIASTGNATDFGDLLSSDGYTKGTTSTANGGLQ